MCSFQDVFDDMFPKSWLDPYGDMPMNPGLQASVDIEVSKSDGVTKVTAVKTPPRSQHMSFEDALSMVLSITSCENGPLCENLQAADLGKRESEKDGQKSDEKVECNASAGGFDESARKPPEEHSDESDEKDANKKKPA